MQEFAHGVVQTAAQIALEGGSVARLAQHDRDVRLAAKRLQTLAPEAVLKRRLGHERHAAVEELRDDCKKQLGRVGVRAGQFGAGRPCART